MPRLTASLAELTPARRRLTMAAIVGTTIPIAVAAALWMGHIFTQADTTHYLNLAAGRPALLPFASRQLGPLLVRGLVRLTHLSVEQAFFLEGTLALLFFVGTVAVLLVRSRSPRWIVPALAGMFFWTLVYNGLVLPDLFYAALLCVFLLLLRKQRLLAAGLMLFPLAVARESTLLTLVCLLAAGWRRLRWSEAAMAIVSAGAGIELAKHLAANALPNTEGISPGLYLIAKLPWNLLKNFLGVDLWANVYRSCPVPRWQMPLHLGPLTAIGVCRFGWRYPVWLAFEAMATFGLLPLLLLKLRRTGVPPSDSREQMLLRFCVVYGVISFCMAGLLGEAFGRLFGYSWPLFLVALPMLLGTSGANFSSNRAAGAFLLLHLSLTWLNVQLHQPLLVIPALVLYGLGWWLLRVSWRAGPAESAVADSAR